MIVTTIRFKVLPNGGVLLATSVWNIADHTGYLQEHSPSGSQLSREKWYTEESLVKAFERREAEIFGPPVDF